MKLAKLKFGRFGTILLFLMLSLLVVLPVFFMLSKSFMSTREILYSQTVNAYTPLKMIPERLSLEQYKAALILDPEFYFYFWNSVFLVVPILAGNLVLSTLAAYGFSKFRFWGKRPLYFLFVFLIVLPYQVLLSPQYIVVRETGLLGSRWSVILPLMCAPLGVFMLTGFIRNVASETLEAARLEGAGEIRIFLQIVLPQVKPGISLLAIFTLMDNWSLVEQPLVFLSNRMRYPLSIALSYIGSERPEVIYASAVFFLIPVLLCFFLGVRSIIANLVKIMKSEAKRS